MVCLLKKSLQIKTMKLLEGNMFKIDYHQGQSFTMKEIKAGGDEDVLR